MRSWPPDPRSRRPPSCGIPAGHGRGAQEAPGAQRTDEKGRGSVRVPLGLCVGCGGGAGGLAGVMVVV